MNTSATNRERAYFVRKMIFKALRLDISENHVFP